MITPDQVKELARCSQDVGYFVRNYVWIRHPAFGFPIRFTPWHWQNGLMYLWQSGYNTISNKSRQIGWSWSALAYALWKLCFHRGSEIYLISYNDDKAKSLMRKLRYMFDRVPDWLRPQTPSRGGDSKSMLAVRMRYFDDALGSYTWADGFVSSLTTTGASGAGESATLVVADEVGLWKERQDDEATWAAVAPTTTHGGQLLVASTPRGYGGVFHRIWVESLSPLMNDGRVTDFSPLDVFNSESVDYYDGRDSFIPIKVHYSMCYHDEEWLQACCRDMPADRQLRIREYFEDKVYDRAWRDRQSERLKLHAALILQEYELLFDRPGNAVFDSGSLNKCYKPPGSNPEIQKAIDASKRFYGGVDTAEGISKTNRQPDYHSLTVLNDKAIQVYSDHNRNPISMWAGTTEVNPVTSKMVEVKGDVLKAIELFPGDWAIEKNGPGGMVINRVLPHLPRRTMMTPVMMTHYLKGRLVTELAYAIENGQTVITDYFTLECLRQYIGKGAGRYEAAPGFYDDPVVSFMLAYYMFQQGGSANWNMSGEAISDETKRAIAMKQDDDMTLEETGVMGRSAGLAPMLTPDYDDETEFAVGPSPVAPFRGNGRSDGFRPGRRPRDERMLPSRLQRPSR